MLGRVRCTTYFRFYNLDVMIRTISSAFVFGSVLMYVEQICCLSFTLFIMFLLYLTCFYLRRWFKIVLEDLLLCHLIISVKSVVSSVCVFLRISCILQAVLLPILTTNAASLIAVSCKILVFSLIVLGLCRNLNSQLVSSIPVAARFSAPVQTGAGAHSASFTMGTEFLYRD
jgi:hypothetical protein